MSEPNNPDQYDTREEEVIDWYNHYKSIPIGDLVRAFVSASGRSGREVNEPMRMAFEDRVEDAEEWLQNHE